MFFEISADNVRMSLVDNLKKLMAEKGFNNRSLADAAGLNPTGVRDIIVGNSMNPRRDTINKIAEALDVLPSNLLGEPLAPKPRMTDSFHPLLSYAPGKHPNGDILIELSAGFGKITLSLDPEIAEQLANDIFVRLDGDKQLHPSRLTS